MYTNAFSIYLFGIFTVLEFRKPIFSSKGYHYVSGEPNSVGGVLAMFYAVHILNELIKSFICLF